MRAVPRVIANRAFHSAVRGIFEGCYSDSGLMQRITGSVMASEVGHQIERAQNYGFSSVPLPPNQSQSGSGGSGGGNPLSEAGFGAEMFFVTPSGNPGHRFCVAIDDRRHRPRGLKAGESYNYDDQGQGNYVARHGTYQIAGGHGQNAEKARSSIRHVTKQRQPFPQMGSLANSQSQQSQPQQSNYRHEGESPTADIFAEKDRGFAQVQKSFLAEIKDGNQYTLVDDEHTAIYAGKGKAVIWVTKDGECLTTKPLRVVDYDKKKPSPSSTGGSDSQSA